MSYWFPRIYDHLMGPLEQKIFKEIRKKLIGKAKGKVLEIGSGTGINFPFYDQADQVIAVEPEPLMLKQSLHRVKLAKIPIEVIEAGGEQLPFADHEFDTVVVTLVLCTIPNPKKALKEIRRVCKVDGQILLFEHVKIDHQVFGPLQDWLTPLWKRICDGCCLNRDTIHSLKEAGFKILSIEKYYKGIFITIEARNQYY